MRLSKDFIKHIADAITENLEAKGLAEYEVPKSAIAEKISRGNYREHGRGRQVE